MPSLSRLLFSLVAASLVLSDIALATPAAFPQNGYCPTRTVTKTCTRTLTSIKTSTKVLKTSTKTLTKTSTKISTKVSTKTATKTSTKVSTTVQNVTKTITSSGIAVTVTDTVTDTFTETSDPTTVISTITETSDPITVSETVTVPSCAASPFGPAFECSPYGYLINQLSLNKLDLTTGTIEVIKDNLNGGESVNAIGYNGQYWIAGVVVDGSQSWWQIDINPYSSTYGQIVDTGITSVGSSLADWTYIPSAGRFLWAIGTTDENHAVLEKFDMVSHTWTRVREWISIVAGFGAVFALDNGDIYAYENPTGIIYKTNVFIQSGLEEVAQGPSVSNADGARCAYNPQVTPV
ncbi:hypothetical protein H072_219 [Dactylellina haptotyla CBS 200.50]|uniref:DUF6923 domain-containing protein n=1 Tax=Dactylellina haptotyla (strain CBS 200.50) TaxID=1284197 RepID=S8AXK4_DACHA|nr:hypothetical protein H072_219 [Dactylellina haptotyla CBS 200.50]